MEQTIADLTFPIFFMIWAEMQGWDVPEFHLEILEFFDEYENWNNSEAVLQVFRGAGKSTIIGLFVVYMLVKDPTKRFLVVSADHKTACKITLDCKSIIERHPLAIGLKGKEQTWREASFNVRGSTDARNPSCTASGVLGNITGSRCDFAIIDDCEIPKNIQNEEMRENLRRRLAEISHVMVPGAQKLFVGTPHAFDSIYPERIQSGASNLFLPLYKNAKGDFPAIEGEPRWPERFTKEICLDKQVTSHSKGNFMSQYMLLPFRVDDGILDTRLLQEYDDEIEFIFSNGMMRAMLGESQMMSVSAFWDVSLAKARTDDSVVALVYTTDDGHIWIHRTKEVFGSADEQCMQVLELLVEFNVPLIIIETNGIGAFLPQIMLKYAQKHEIGVDGRPSFINKAVRIIEALETPLCAGLLHAHKSVMNGKFITQVREFTPKNVIYDKNDYIDAVSSAIGNEPIRIRAKLQDMTPINRWQQGQLPAEIELDYTTI